MHGLHWIVRERVLISDDIEKRFIFQPFKAGMFLLMLLMFATPALAQDGATLTVTALTDTLVCGNTRDVTFGYAPDGPSTPGMRGYSVNIVAPVNLTFAAADVTVFSPLVGVNDTHFITENGPGDVTVDFTFLATGAVLDQTADLFTITMSGIGTGTAIVGVNSQVFRDLGNQTITVDASATAQFEQICDAPSIPTLDPEPAFTGGTVNQISWSDEGTGVPLKYLAQVSTSPAFTTLKDNSGWISALTFTFTNLADGVTYYYRVKAGIATDTAVNSDYSATEISVQDSSPPITTAGPLDPAVFVVGFQVPFQATDAVSGIDQVELFWRYQGGAWSSYGSFAASPVPFAALSGDGLYEFYTRGTDVAGNVEAVPAGPQAATTLDTSQPFGFFDANGGAVATNDPNVTLDITVVRATEMRFSNDNATWPEGWVPLAASHPWTIPAVEANQTIYGEFRDGVGGLLATTDDIIYDITAPGVATAVTAAVGHETVTVSWTPPADTDYGYGEVWRGVLHDGADNSAYPNYAGATIPTPPTDRAAAVASTEWILAGVSGPGESVFSDPISARGVYYYEVFAFDQGDNFSGPAGDLPRSTNYVLADVIQPYDGVVAVHDLTLLGANFGLVDTDPGFNAEVDYGPTDDATGTGIPEPDGAINFEDEMIAALNFGTGAKSGAVTSDKPVSLAWRPSGPATWTLALVSPHPGLKGVRLASALPLGVVPTVTAGAGATGGGNPHLLLNDARRGLDAGLVTLGSSSGFATGDLLTVVLPVGADSDLLAGDRVTIELRDRSNRNLAFSLQEKAGEQIPAAFALDGIFPNPFNPSTTIGFSLPVGAHVSLEIFGLDGRRVAVLADETFEAGRHERTWLGRDDGGRQVASGVYFARLRAGAFSQVLKMTLMK